MFQPTETLTAYNAEQTLQQGLQAIVAGQTNIDLAGLTMVDSAAVATLLAWKRAAADQGKQITFHHVPPSLRSLADLYGVNELLVN